VPDVADVSSGFSLSAFADAVETQQLFAAEDQRGDICQRELTI
jgi:hypothetical protein